MPLNKRNIGRSITRTVYAGLVETVTLLKRNDGQQAGIVTAYTLFRCRKSMVARTGEILQGEMTSSDSTIWHIPKMELDRIGIKYLSALDRIVDSEQNYWQPEGTTTITQKLLGQEIDLACLKVDPPNAEMQSR